MDTYALTGSQLSAYSGILKEHAVVTRLGVFAFVREMRAIARSRLFWIAGFQRYIGTAQRCQQYVAEIAVPGTREMRVRETENGCVFVTISGCPLVALLKWSDLCIGRDLDHAERRGCSRERMPLGASANHWINKLQGISSLC